MKKYAISHNDIGEIDRGPWRKYNPYNPYVPEEEKQKKVDNLKVESLDDLFEDDLKTEPKEEKKEDKIPQSATVAAQENSNKKPENDGFETLDLNDFETDAPMLPQDDDDGGYDLQKELEAKFDELFGPLDED